MILEHLALSKALFRAGLRRPAQEIILLALLYRPGQCASSLLGLAEIPVRSSIYKHLIILEELGLVTQEPKGRAGLYYPTAKAREIIAKAERQLIDAKAAARKLSLKKNLQHS